MNDREKLLLIFHAGLEAVAPDTALLSHISIDNDKISADNASFTIPEKGLRVLGAGKGAAPMALAFENLLGNRIQEGFVVVKYDHELDLKHFQVAQAAHPVPDAAGQKAAERCLEIAGKCKPGDLLVCLFTGGASALLPAPVAGLTLDDLREVTRALLDCGAEIGEINAIRRHLSRIGGGGLARAAGGAQVLSLIVSDVVGDKLQDIASGPTFPDPTSFADCLEIIRKYGISEKLPEAALEYLQKGAEKEKNSPPEVGVFTHVKNVVIASNRQAIEASAKKARALEMDIEIISGPVTGEARLASKMLIERAREIQKNIIARPVCLLAGGETTVTIRGKGKGGRNQEMALQAALELEGTKGISCIFAGTDGTDGPVDAAGGFAFAGSVAKMGGRQMAEAFLSDNNSYEALLKSGDLLVTGPTRTNVMDMCAIIVYPLR